MCVQKQKKLLGTDNSTKLLKHLEISLRTNSIEWVREFLNESNDGLRVLVEFMTFLQDCGGLQ